jgi:hypothetical chaperone protein
MHIGLDFGTTNSAIAIAGPESVRLAKYGSSHTYRTLLYFDPNEQVGGRPAVFAGPSAIDRYLVGDGSGRLIQSIKSHLASRLFDRTMVFGRPFALPELVALFLERLFRDAERDLGPIERRRMVVGRPVRYASAETEEDDALAVARMRQALALVGVVDPIFEPEPLAAAHAYQSTLDHDELVLVADFGGGTTDFCLMRLGPRASKGGSQVLAIDGVGVAGDAFDGELVMHTVAPTLGLGSRYRMRDKQNESLEVPRWIYSKVRRWHHLSLLRSRETLALLDDLRKQSHEPEKLVALIHVIEADLGFHLYRAVEGTKVALTAHERARLHFDDPPAVIDSEVARSSFDQWIEEPLSAIAAALDRTLVKANVSPNDVDAVFMTGGTSLVPAVRGLFAKRFGERKLRGGNELISVALGLAHVAHDLGDRSVTTSVRDS